MLSFAIVSAAFAVAVSAQTPGYHEINRPGMREDVPACAPYTILWTPSGSYSGAVTFQLIGGATQNTLVPIGGMFGNVPASEGSYLWNVPCDAGSESVYGLKIHQASDSSVFQYSTPFQIVAGGNTGSPTGTSASATSLGPSPTGTNTTSTEVTSGFSTTSAMNATVTSPTPSNPITTLTSMTTTEGTPTTSPDDLVSAASTYRMTTGSFAVLAAAAAAVFFAL